MPHSSIAKIMPYSGASKRALQGVLVACGIVTQFAAAAPQVSAVSGSATYGASLTVTGSGFGTKPTAGPPVVWDPCSAAGLSAQWSGGWPNASPTSSDNIACRAPIRGVALPHQHTGMYLAGSHGGNSGYNAGWNVMVYKSRTISAYPAYTYASWYQRSDDNWTFCSDDNYKDWDYSTAADPYSMPNNWYIEYNPRPTSTTAIPSWHLNDDSAVGIQSPDANGKSWWWSPAVNPMGGKWSKIEVEIKYTQDSTGYIHLWENGVLKINYAGKTDGYPGTQRSEAIGGYSRCSGYESNWRYFADLYLDYSRARVVLANNATYANATVIEPQIVQSWSDSSISLKVNTGTLPTNQPMYLFVMTDSGVMSPLGVAVNATGSNPAAKIPDAPTGVTVR